MPAARMQRIADLAARSAVKAAATAAGQKRQARTEQRNGQSIGG